MLKWSFFLPNKVSDELKSQIEALQVHRKINSERLEMIRKQHESSRIWCKVSRTKIIDLFPRRFALDIFKTFDQHPGVSLSPYVYDATKPVPEVQISSRASGALYRKSEGRMVGSNFLWGHEVLLFLRTPVVRAFCHRNTTMYGRERFMLKYAKTLCSFVA